MANRSLAERHWFPSNAPQTLQIAVALLYWNAVLSLLGAAHGWPLLFMVGDALSAYGIANYRKWGYVLAIAAAVAPLVLLIAVGGYFAVGLLTLLFEIALVALLLHPQSRSYYKIWFR